ncbi:MAG: ATP-binding cassette domain-containing protein [Bacteroidota bacterium]
MDISVKNLSKKYGSQKAVDNISFSVKTGEILGFLGPNGAGKTTTMKILTTYLSATEGEVTIGSYDVMQEADKIKHHIGYLPENNPLYLDMPVLEYLQFMAETQGVAKSDIPGRIATIVSQCGLNVEKHKKIGELSKGYKQRVGLAQALIHDPEILILDEPTTGLDPNQIVEIRNLIKEIGREKTVILSTHILPEVEATCDRILIIKEGNIVADGTPESLSKKAEENFVFRVQIKSPKSDALADELRKMEEISLVEVLDSSEGRFEITAKMDMPFREKLFNTCVKEGWILTELQVIEASLEDIFRELTLN